MVRICCTMLACMALALLSPWPWATLIVVVGSPVLLGLWVVASLTDNPLRITPGEKKWEGGSAPVDQRRVSD